MIINSKFVLICCLLLSLPFLVSGINAISVDIGLTWAGNLDSAGILNPIFLGAGCSYFLHLTSWGLYYKPRIFFFGSNYIATENRVLPAEDEIGEFFVLTGNIDNFVGVHFKISKDFEWGAGIGLAVLLRLPISLFEDTETEISSYYSYFYGKGRFALPGAELFFTWNFNKYSSLSITIKGMFPLFHLWDGEGLTFIDQLHLQGLAGFMFKI